MKKRLILLAGLGVGYILGSRTGRQSYEKLKAQLQELWTDPKVQETVDKANQSIREKVRPSPMPCSQRPTRSPPRHRNSTATRTQAPLRPRVRRPDRRRGRPPDPVRPRPRPVVPQRAQCPDRPPGRALRRLPDLALPRRSPPLRRRPTRNRPLRSPLARRRSRPMPSPPLRRRSLPRSRRRHPRRPRTSSPIRHGRSRTKDRPPRRRTEALCPGSTPVTEPQDSCG